MHGLWLNLLLICCCLLGVCFGAAWELPTADEMQDSLQQCRTKAAGEQANTLRCLVERLGLWTDELGYNGKRIAKIFAAQQQMEELMLVIEYCNQKERRPAQPAQWALATYRCATSGRFGRWVKDYMKEQHHLNETLK